MNFDWTEKENKLRQAMELLAREKLVGIELSLGEIPVGESRAQIAQTLDSLKREGYLNFNDPRQAVPGSLFAAAGKEVLARDCPTFFLILESGISHLAQLVFRFGSQEQKGQFIVPLLTGKAFSAVTLLSPENRGLVLNAPWADLIGILTREEGGEEGFLLITPKQNPGLSLGEPRPIPGYAACTLSACTLEALQIASSQIIGPIPFSELALFYQALEDQVTTFALLGLMESSYQAARDFAKTQKSDAKPLIASQEVGYLLAEMLTLIQTAQLLLYRASWLAQSADSDAPSVALAARSFMVDAAKKVTTDALEILSREGIQPNHPVQRNFQRLHFGLVGARSNPQIKNQIADYILSQLGV
jgi:alkylation response protein AidB-like acyl-CoA dehydrogenase